MAEHKVIATDAEIEAVLQRAARRKDEPLAQFIELIQDLNLIIVGLSNHQRLVLPIANIQGLREATLQQLQNHELVGRGTAISFPDLDVDLYLSALIEGEYENRRWMADMGKKGGRAKTPAKRRASQANGAEGGRPRKAVA